MNPTQPFNYQLPSQATLVGINIEATDSPSEAHACADKPPCREFVGQTPRPEELYGYTLTVDDDSESSKALLQNEKKPVAE